MHSLSYFLTIRVTVLLLCTVALVHSRPILKPAIYQGYRVHRQPNGLLNLLKAFAKIRSTNSVKIQREDENNFGINESSQPIGSRLDCDPVKNPTVEMESSIASLFSSSLLKIITGHLVAIGYRLPLKSHRTSPTRHLCGGVYLTSGWVLTAAHCLSQFKSERSKQLLRVNTYAVHKSTPTEQDNDNKGESNDDDDSATAYGGYRPTGNEFTVQQVVIHPEFREDNKLSVDLALIHLYPPCGTVNNSLASDLSIIPDIQNITNSEMDTTGTQSASHLCVVAGSGRLEYGHINYRHEDQYLHVAKVTKMPCASLLDQFKHGLDHTPGCDRACSFRLKLESDHICAGGGHGDGDTCQGDSGGPLICAVPTDRNPTNKWTDRWQLVGIASVGIGCGMNGVPSVYVKLANHRQWIVKILSRKQPNCFPAQTEHS
ncbi:hypothetical protein D915_006593 [Fasciola hepatica]|uniref:Peptidase S1 domain-containing protein n=1 Tax=Fasciola hepatica TaxID=6192 RepID=A0A4E0R3N3_FASHE|nr:hypothetical protein D915_006593 [Fasciola hepatica]